MTVPPPHEPADVLVVEDDEAIRDTLSFLLRDVGYAVLEAADGPRALALLRGSAHPLVVLLDYLMPGMDGLAVLRAADDDPHLAGRHTFLLMSAHRDLAEQADPLREVPPSVPILVKPFNIDDLLAAVAHAAGLLHEGEQQAR